jgi:hypothetical protein
VHDGAKAILEASRTFVFIRSFHARDKSPGWNREGRHGV